MVAEQISRLGNGWEGEWTAERVSGGEEMGK